VRDLQVWFNLAWIDPHHAATDPVLRELVSKGRDFAEGDKEPILRTQLDLLHRVLGRYQEVRRRGQAEVITSPYYHPILPLLCDVTVAKEARPDLKLPRRRFSHPEDAATQLRLAVEAHARTFGARSAGLWPPEAAISDAALDVIGEQGFSWLISDEGVLARTLDTGIARDGEGRVMRPDVLYAPYRIDRKRPLTIVFRDAKLSNLIGFDYQTSGAEQAAADLVSRLHAIRERQDPVSYTHLTLPTKA